MYCVSLLNYNELIFNHISFVHSLSQKEITYVFQFVDTLGDNSMASETPNRINANTNIMIVMTMWWELIVKGKNIISYLVLTFVSQSKQEKVKGIMGLNSKKIPCNHKIIMQFEYDNVMYNMSAKSFYWFSIYNQPASKHRCYTKLRHIYVIQSFDTYMLFWIWLQCCKCIYSYTI
jgi:hypothetical protein